MAPNEICTMAANGVDFKELRENGSQTVVMAGFGAVW